MKTKAFHALLVVVTSVSSAPAWAQSPKVEPDNPLVPMFSEIIRSAKKPVMDAALAHDDIHALESEVNAITPLSGGSDFLLSWFISHINEGDTYWIGQQLAILTWKIGVVSESIDAQGSSLFKTRAVIAAANTLAQIMVEGARCEDMSAWQAKWDAVIAQRPLWEFSASLPMSARQSIVAGAVATEGKLAPKRRNDAILCSGGIDSIGTALENGAAATVSSVPGLPGRTVVLPIDPKSQPVFVPEVHWRKRQAEIRETLPALLAKVLQASEK